MEQESFISKPMCQFKQFPIILACTDEFTFMNQLVLTVTGISSARPRPAPSPAGKPAAAAAAAEAFRSAVCRRSLAFLRAACKI